MHRIAQTEANQMGDKTPKHPPKVKKPKAPAKPPIKGA
jgi:hypothetical protein